MEAQLIFFKFCNSHDHNLIVKILCLITHPPKTSLKLDRYELRSEFTTSPTTELIVGIKSIPIKVNRTAILVVRYYIWMEAP